MSDYTTIDIEHVITRHKTKRQRKFSYKSQCDGKERYTWKQAEKNKRRINRAKNIEFDFYFCEYCKHYHVGRI